MLSESRGHAIGQFMRRDFVLLELKSAAELDNVGTWSKYFKRFELEE